MRKYAVLPALLLFSFASGCMYEMRDEFNECKINCYNKWQARRAYTGMDTACLGLSCPHSFKEGFVTGYVDVANGGTGCVPAVPVISAHNHMWMDRCSENEKMESWYDGYEHGAMAAKAEGMADSNRVVTRMPHATPVESTMPASGAMDGSAGQPIPPAPLSTTDDSGGPQTRRLTKDVFQ